MGLLRRGQRGPVAARRFEQRKGAVDVRGDEFGRAMDRAVDMALGSEMNDRARFVFGQYRSSSLSTISPCTNTWRASPSSERRLLMLSA
jgi:hypothetical protein